VSHGFDLLSKLNAAGTVISQFESGMTRGGNAIVHVRILKALTPIAPVDASYDGYVPMPTVGDLLRNPNGEPVQVQITGRQSALAILLRGVPGAGYISPLVAARGFQRVSPQVPRSVVVLNLDPGKIDPADFLDLTGKKYSVVHVLGRELELQYDKQPKPTIHFPTGTHGFLYATDGFTLRFRVTKDAQPASFALGHDLLLPTGQAWMVRSSLLRRNS
jgi:hypothetical protein